NAIILCHHPLPSLLGSGSKPLQLFGLRKTPELSLALVQALSPLGRNGLSSSDGRLARTARSHILADLADTRGVSRTSRYVRRDAMDARYRCNPLRDERCPANGEAVWFWRPKAGVKFAGCESASDGDNNVWSPGRARRKPLKPSRRECR